MTRASNRDREHAPRGSTFVRRARCGGKSDDARRPPGENPRALRQRVSGRDDQDLDALARGKPRAGRRVTRRGTVMCPPRRQRGNSTGFTLNADALPSRDDANRTREKTRGNARNAAFVNARTRRKNCFSARGKLINALNASTELLGDGAVFVFVFVFVFAVFDSIVADFYAVAR